MAPWTSPKVSSWPWSLRLLHLALALTLIGALGLGGVLHVWAGLAATGIAALRLILGFIGPRPARFAAMVPGPVLADLAALLRRKPWAGPGLRPINGVIGFLLLLAAAGAGVSGFAALDELQNGPGKGIIIGVPPSFAAEPEAEAPPPSFVARNFHAGFAALALALLILHIVGTALASWAERRNLFAGIVAGAKRRE